MRIADGFRGSWTKDQAYLDDFDAAIVKWGKSQIYSLRFANISQTVSQQKPKSREEQKYEYAQNLVWDMNRHGYSRGEVNRVLESAGLMDDLVSHGFEKVGRSFKKSEEYKYEAIAALNSYIDRYDAAHGNKRQTSANVPTQGEDVEFHRAWLQGWGYVTGSFFGAAFAHTASKFTSDPKKIAAAAGLGAAFEGAAFSVAGALVGGGSYRPEVVGPRDRPAAVAPWRYTGKQPIKPVADPAKVGAPPAAPVAETPPLRQQLLLPAESPKNPRIIQQEGTVERRKVAVKAATTKHNEASSRAANAEAAVVAAKQRVAATQTEAQAARATAERAKVAAQGRKRNTVEAKDATAKRNAAVKAEKLATKANNALKTANDELTRARSNAAKAAKRAKDARADLKTSRDHLERLLTNPDAGPRQLAVVQAPRTLKGPNGGTIIDHGYEGRRRDDPPPGHHWGRFAHTDANYQSMLNGRPPIGEDGAPINLHHRTRGPMSRLDEYTETRHRELGLHEPGLDSEIDRNVFNRQRERYWVQRARDLLQRR